MFVVYQFALHGQQFTCQTGKGNRVKHLQFWAGPDCVEDKKIQSYSIVQLLCCTSTSNSQNTDCNSLEVLLSKCYQWKRMELKNNSHHQLTPLFVGPRTWHSPGPLWQLQSAKVWLLPSSFWWLTLLPGWQAIAEQWGDHICKKRKKYTINNLMRDVRAYSALQKYPPPCCFYH